MKKNILSLGLLVSLLTLGTLAFNSNNSNTLEVRDVLTENFSKEASGRLVKKESNEVAENKLSQAKAQISSVNENGTRHIRFVAALDSYLYDNVSFTITANNGEETKTLVQNESVTTAYTHLIVAGETLSASEAFGDSYSYLVAYTINNVPESAWDYSFTATVSARAQGYNEDVTTSATRVISEMAAVEDEMNKEEVVKENPIITFNYTAGSTFTIGSNERPTATVSEGADYVITYSSDTTGYNSVEYPTVAGTYSLVVTVNENEKYNSAKDWLWFKLVDATKVDPEVNFSIEKGTTLTLGVDAEPTVTVTEGLTYKVHYEQNEAYYGDTFPTVAGTYSMVVNVTGNDQYNDVVRWVVFTLVEPEIKDDEEIVTYTGSIANLKNNEGVDAAYSSVKTFEKDKVIKFDSTSDIEWVASYGAKSDSLESGNDFVFQLGNFLYGVSTYGYTSNLTLAESSLTANTDSTSDDYQIVKAIDESYVGSSKIISAIYSKDYITNVQDIHLYWSSVNEGNGKVHMLYQIQGEESWNLLNPDDGVTVTQTGQTGVGTATRGDYNRYGYSNYLTNDSKLKGKTARIGFAYEKGSGYNNYHCLTLGGIRVNSVDSAINLADMIGVKGETTLSDNLVRQLQFAMYGLNESQVLSLENTVITTFESENTNYYDYLSALSTNNGI